MAMTNLLPMPTMTSAASFEVPFQHDAPAESAVIPEGLSEFVLHSPSLLGRVIQIASCWDAVSEKYQNPPGADFDPAVVDNTMRRMHLEAFTNWLALSLKAQKRDLAVYINLSDYNDRVRKLSQVLRDAERLVPTGANPEERKLFIQDLRIVRALVQEDL
jgi:hypothetical protein